MQKERLTVCGMYLYEHDVVVVGGAVVLRVRKQKLRQDFLFCALIDGQRVIPRHDHHSVHPAEMKASYSHHAVMQRVR